MENSYSRREFSLGVPEAQRRRSLAAAQVPVIDCHTHAGTGTALTAPCDDNCRSRRDSPPQPRGRDRQSLYLLHFP